MDSIQQSHFYTLDRIFETDRNDQVMRRSPEICVARNHQQAITEVDAAVCQSLNVKKEAGIKEE